MIMLTFLNILQASFYDKGLEGRYYYQEFKKETHEKEKITQENALSALNLFQQEFETAKALAVMEPTYPNIVNYLKIQKKVLENSERFAQIWGSILLENAFLSDQLQNPTAAFAVTTRKRLEEEQITTFIETLKKDHVLLFIFDSTDPFSRTTAEIAKDFEQDTGWQVIGVSLDGGVLPQFPTPRILADRGSALGLDASPAFLVVNPDKDESISVGLGAISVSQLRENIYNQLSRRCPK